MFNYIEIGKIVATFGVKGELILNHALGKRSNLKGVESIFVQTSKTAKLPYFVTKATGKTTDETLLLVEGVATKEAAKLLVGKPVWLLAADYEAVAAKNSSILLLGYKVINANDNTTVGEVQEVIEQAHQILLAVGYKGNQAYIPLHNENMIKTDSNKKELIIDIPEGLLDIYE